MEKAKPTINIIENEEETTGTELNMPEVTPFIQMIKSAFKNCYALLEAKRLIKAKNKNDEIELILNNEEKTDTIKAKERFPFIR